MGYRFLGVRLYNGGKELPNDKIHIPQQLIVLFYQGQNSFLYSCIFHKSLNSPYAANLSELYVPISFSSYQLGPTADSTVRGTFIKSNLHDNISFTINL